MLAGGWAVLGQALAGAHFFSRGGGQLHTCYWKPEPSPIALGSPEAKRVCGVPAYDLAGRAAAPPSNVIIKGKKAILLTSPGHGRKEGQEWSQANA